MFSESLLADPSPRAERSAYLVLGVSILFEVFGTLCMRLALDNALWRVGAYGAYAASFSLFPFALERIPLGIAYATWSSTGTLSIVLLSRAFFEELLTIAQMVGIAGTIVSVVLLHA